MTKSLTIRRAEVEDATAVADIYNQGIDERVATFNTEHVTADERRERIEKGDDKLPILVAILGNGKVVGWGSISQYSSRACYMGIGEVSMYVMKECRGQGIGKTLLQSLINSGLEQRYWKLMARIFVSNQTSLNLFGKLGFRVIGILEKHGKLDGKWLDVVEMEGLIPENIT